jgi:hypothetical protein
LPEEDDIKPLKPLNTILNLGEDIVDIKWILNDTFLIVVTKSNLIVIFDSLLHPFNIGAFTDIDMTINKYMKVNFGKPLANIKKSDPAYKIKGSASPLNFTGTYLPNMN